jgi:hypothetical protein
VVLPQREWPPWKLSHVTGYSSNKSIMDRPGDPPQQASPSLFPIYLEFISPCAMIVTMIRIIIVVQNLNYYIFRWITKRFPFSLKALEGKER